MKVGHVTASITTSGGGIPIVLQALSSAQSRSEMVLHVVGHDDGGAPIDNWPKGCLSALSILRFPGMPWAGTMDNVLRGKSTDLLLIHGLWSQASIVVPRISRSERIPYLVSPHGMLDPWALANSRWKKKIAALLYERRNLRAAACLHALCGSEKESIRAYGLTNPVCVIPNGVDLPVEDAETLTTEKLKSERKILLFLGRLHPKKGLVNAIRAWHSHLTSLHNPRSSEWQFVIAGWDQGGHEAELKRLCDELEIPWADLRDYPQTESNSVSPFSFQFSAFSLLFTGPAFGPDKNALLRAASAFILPSFSEGLPMSVLEAWSYHVPVLMTDHCNLPEGFTADAAFRIGTDVQSIAEGIRLLHQSTNHELQAFGLNGRALVERQFTWPMVAAQMKEVYEWVLGGGEEPGCVEM